MHILSLCLFLSVCVLAVLQKNFSEANLHLLSYPFCLKSVHRKRNTFGKHTQNGCSTFFRQSKTAYSGNSSRIHVCNGVTFIRIHQVKLTFSTELMKNRVTCFVFSNESMESSTCAPKLRKR